MIWARLGTCDLIGCYHCCLQSTDVCEVEKRAQKQAVSDGKYVCMTSCTEI